MDRIASRCRCNYDYGVLWFFSKFDMALGCVLWILGFYRSFIIGVFYSIFLFKMARF